MAMLSFGLIIGFNKVALAQDNNDIPLGEDDVWVNADGYVGKFSNVRYRIIGMSQPNVYELTCVEEPIYLQDSGIYTIYAGYPLGERSIERDISDQTEANFNDLDCWYATGEVSTWNPTTNLVFRSQLAKIYIELDMSTYPGDTPYFSASAIQAANKFTCGPDYPVSIIPSESQEIVDLKVERIKEKIWKIEGLLIPSHPGKLRIQYGTDNKDYEFSELYGKELSAGKVYSAKLTYDSQTQTFEISDQQSTERSTFTAEFTAGTIFLARYDVLPQTISSSTPIEMEQSESSGTSIEKALKGTVTVPYEINQVSISDIEFSTSYPGHETITFDNGNPLSINGNSLYGFIRLSSESKWSSGPIPLEEGMTQTVLIKLQYTDFDRYYSIDITRSPKPISTISISPAQLNFGELDQGYQSVASESLTIENTGNTSIVLQQPASSTSFDVGTLGSLQLDPGNTTTFTIAPRIGLTSGTYDETITIKGTNGIEATISVSVVVKPIQQEETIHHSTHSSCDVYDKNCDGVITCEERYGQGWTWSEPEKACIMTSFDGSKKPTNSGGYSFVDTADQ